MTFLKFLGTSFVFTVTGMFFHADAGTSSPSEACTQNLGSLGITERYQTARSCIQSNLAYLQGEQKKLTRPVVSLATGQYVEFAARALSSPAKTGAAFFSDTHSHLSKRIDGHKKMLKQLDKSYQTELQKLKSNEGTAAGSLPQAPQAVPLPLEKTPSTGSTAPKEGSPGETSGIPTLTGPVAEMAQAELLAAKYPNKGAGPDVNLLQLETLEETADLGFSDSPEIFSAEPVQSLEADAQVQAPDELGWIGF